MKNIPRARDIMSRRVAVVGPDVAVFDAARLLVKRKIHAVPVVDEEREMLGLFSHQNLMTALVQIAHQDAPAGRVSEYLDADPPVVHEGATLLTIVQAFVLAGYAYPVLPVLREGRLVGVVSRLDVARCMMNAVGPAAGVEAALPYLSAADPDDSPFDGRRGGRS